MPLRSHFLALAAAMALCVAHAATCYVAPDGSADGDGSSGKPWPSIVFALGKVGGGNTVVLKPGAYRGPVTIGAEHAGTREYPTVIKSEEKWRAAIIGSPSDGIYSNEGCDWLVVDGLEVMGARGVGITLHGDHSVVRNCWVHSNLMGVAMHGRRYGLIERNLVEFNGIHIQFDHGIYADGEHLTIRRNIVRHNAAYGIHLYPAIRRSVISQNLVYGHANRAGVIVTCPAGGGRNVVANNTIAANAWCISISDGDGEVVVNNILASARKVFNIHEGTRNLRVDHNLCSVQPEVPGPHDTVADPAFADPEHGVFWLRSDSPAIGRANPRYAPGEDFWGRPLPRGVPPDIGAFSFDPSFLTGKARGGWYEGWPYSPGDTMPDLWATPCGGGSPDAP